MVSTRERNRPRIRAQEAAILASLAMAWTPARSRIMALLIAFLAALSAARQAAGGELPIMWLYQQYRLPRLLQQIEQILEQTTGHVDKTLIQRIRGAMILDVQGQQPAVTHVLNQALDAAQSKSETFAISEFYDAYRADLIDQYAASDQGWVWRTVDDDRVCPFCEMMEGSEHPAGEEMVTHPGCRCEPEPIELSEPIAL